jgi:hypothetical protein
MTTHTESVPVLFGEPYCLKPHDCAQKFEWLATLAPPEDSGTQDVASLSTESTLLTGYCEAFSLIAQENFHTYRVIGRVKQHLLQLLLESTRRMEAIGFTAGIMFSNSHTLARTDAETHTSITACLGKACTVCLTLEQELTQIVAQHQPHTPTVTAPTLEEATALSISRNKGRQNAS